MKVDFYVLDQANQEKSLRFACQCAEQAYHDQKQIYLHLNSPEAAEHLDKLLWTFRDDSFLPHHIISSESSIAPIQIGYHDTQPHSHDLLINLTNTIPTFYSQFERVIEIVFSDSDMQQLARERYRLYREQGCEINTIKIKTP